MAQLPGDASVRTERLEPPREGNFIRRDLVMQKRGPVVIDVRFPLGSRLNSLAGTPPLYPSPLAMSSESHWVGDEVEPSSKTFVRTYT